MNYIENEIYTGAPEYYNAFMDVIRGKDYCIDKLSKGRSMDTRAYAMPVTSSKKYTSALEKESLFRQIGTVINAYNSSYRIFAKNCNDLAQFVPEGGSIPLYDAVNDFTEYRVDTHKLAVFVKLDDDFIHDATFDIENYLIGRLAKKTSA